MRQFATIGHRRLAVSTARALSGAGDPARSRTSCPSDCKSDRSEGDFNSADSFMVGRSRQGQPQRHDRAHAPRSRAVVADRCNCQQDRRLTKAARSQPPTAATQRRPSPRLERVPLPFAASVLEPPEGAPICLRRARVCGATQCPIRVRQCRRRSRSAKRARKYSATRDYVKRHSLQTIRGI